MKSEYEMIQGEFGKNTVYIGDAVYASHDGCQFWLFTSVDLE